MSGIWHSAGCSQPPPHRRHGIRGDLLDSCTDCGRYVVVEADGVWELPPIPPAPQVFRAGWPTHKARRRLRSQRKPQ